MSTISYPSTGIPLSYLIQLDIQNTTSCPSNKQTIPSGNIIYAGPAEMLRLCPDNENVNVPAGYCFPLTSISGENKGSVIYYYAPTCGTLPFVNYFCLYQFYDPSTQNCGNAKNVNGIFISSVSSSFVCYPNKNNNGVNTGTISTITLSSSPSSLWGNNNGITTVTTANGCEGTIISYDYTASSCVSNDDDGTSANQYCTTSGVKYNYYYGTSCNPKNIMVDYTISATKSLNTFYSNPYECELSTADNNGVDVSQYNLTIFYNTGNGNSVNSCYSNSYNKTYSIGSFYTKTQCSQSRTNTLSTAAIVCLTFFIPLIFYIICWIIIVKIMKRGDLVSKALCLDSNKKASGLATKEVSIQSKTDSESNFNRI